LEKNLKKFRTVAIVLVIVLISLVAFVGVFRKSLNSMKNVIPDYTYGMELNGERELKFVIDTSSEEKEVYIDEEGNILGEVKEDDDDDEEEGISLSTDEETDETENESEETDEDETSEEDEISYATETRTIKVNEDEALTKDNFELTKKVIQTRLNKAGISEYNIRLDNITGSLVVEVPDNDDVSIIYELIETKGLVQIIDHQTGLILIDGNHIKSSSAVYSSSDGYQAYLQINFDKEGTEILKEISNKYVALTDDTGETTTKYVEVTLDGETLLTTYFGEELSGGVIQIPMGSSTTDVSEFRSTYESTSYIANIINNGQTPVVYALSSDNFIQSNITDNQKLIAVCIVVAVIAIVSLYYIIRYGVKGFLAVISNIGFIAVLSLILRYTKVTITINSAIAFLAVEIANLVYLKMLLKEMKEGLIAKAYTNVMKKYYLSIIPICVVAVIFTFMANITVSSIGMVIFWGLFIQVFYNFIFTRTFYLGSEK
jgi:preprotein translocase subunit SecD